MFTVLYDEEALQNLEKLEKEFSKKLPRQKKNHFIILRD
jgi:hypothetical protein